MSILTPPSLNKDRIEDMCRRAGLIPAGRRPMRGYDVLIADGESAPPHDAFRRFGVEEDEFEDGCFVTFWWLLKDEFLFVANPIFFEKDHDPWLDPASKKQARINRAMQTAEEWVTRYKEQTKH